MTDTQTNQTTEQKIPTTDEIINLLKEQIRVKRIQLELQELNTALAKTRKTEVEALTAIAMMTNPRPQENPYEGGIPHTVTQEDIEANPELQDLGVNVGDEILLHPDGQEDPGNSKEQKRTLKKNN